MAASHDENTGSRSMSLTHNSAEKYEPGGAARYGNFMNYYSFNSVSKRLEALPTDLFSKLNVTNDPIVCLDIGCNSGDLTSGLYSHLSSGAVPELYFLGVDLDEELITRSNETNEHPTNIFYEQLNIMDDSTTEVLTAFLGKYWKNTFDVITCFSTTMWIHLNHGDNGYKNFLKRMSQICNFLLLEPQEWKCYKAAVRRMTRLNREVFAIKKLKMNDIINQTTAYLSSDCGMELVTCYGETSWGRKLYLYKRIENPP